MPKGQLYCCPGCGKRSLRPLWRKFPRKPYGWSGFWICEDPDCRSLVVIADELSGRSAIYLRETTKDVASHP